MKWCLYLAVNSLHWRSELTGSYLMVLAHCSKTTISEKGAFGLEIVEKVVSIDSALKLGDDIHFESPPQGISRTMNEWSLVKIDQSIRSRIHMWKKGREIRKKLEIKSKRITPSDNYWLLSFFRTRSCSTTWKNIPIDRQRGSKGVSLHGVKFCCGITYWFSLWCYCLSDETTNVMKPIPSHTRKR